MKIFRTPLLLFFSLGITNLLIAVPTTKEAAFLKAQQFYASTAKSALRSAVELKLVYTDTGRDTQAPAGFYVFNAGQNNGFVMVSGDDRATPILAYTDQGRFPTENIPSNLQSWLDFYHQEMQAVEKGMEVYTPTKSASHTTVEPLLGGIKWNQGTPYNNFCPLSIDGTQRTVVGCVATAMAQVMKYYQWPPKSTGTYVTYIPTYDFETGEESFDTTYTQLGEVLFRWEDMIESYTGSSTSKQDSAVALLSYHCGIAVNMDYGTAAQGGSSALSFDVERALENFGYDPDMRYLNRDYYDQTSWADLMMHDLDAGRPILYSGYSKTIGHEFVCDGYDTNGLFHFNWGWGGTGDGYYVISVVNPTGGASGGYVYGQDALIGIRKDDGIVNPTPSYEMGMFNKSLTSNKPVLQSVNEERFSVKFGFLNLGANLFKGKIGVALYKDEAFLKSYALDTTFSLGYFYGSNNSQLDSLSLAGFSDGNYRLYTVYQPDWSATWFKIRAMSIISNYLEVRINGGSATFINPDLGPAFVQTSPIVAKGDVYQHKTSSFSVSVKNNGEEFNAYMSLCLRSTTDSKKVAYLGNVFTLIGKGETKVLDFDGKLTVDTGSYEAYVVYDSLSENSTWNYKMVSLGNFTPFLIQLHYYPGHELTLNRKMEIVGGDSIYQRKEFSLNVEFANSGGTYDNEVAIQLYPAEPGFQVGQTGITPIVVDSGSTKEYILKGSFKVPPGSYRLCVYCTKKNGVWDRVMPINPVQLDYDWYIRIKVVAEPTDLDALTTNGLHIGRNPVGASIELITDEKVLQSVIYDVNGRDLGRFGDETSIPASDLQKGVYLLRVTTDKGMRSVRFIK